jgi:tetratricopeptide (TPR) repeat protein
LADEFTKIIAASPETSLGATDGSQSGGGASPGEASGAIAPAQMGKQEALKKFTVDLTEQARSGKMDPIVGRDDEIRQLVDILMRRRQNNPILIGEAGVGKTAVVEGFAQRIARGDVPPSLKDVELRSLDVGLLQAGASMKGEFEQRLRSVIDEVQASAKPIILFIDEAHTLVGAGGAAGTGDAANLLKPALARGTLRTVAATTFAEYKKHIEKDPALTRRFQTVQVDEPDEARAILMMRGVASTMEKHHPVQILDEALEAYVTLAATYPKSPLIANVMLRINEHFYAKEEFAVAASVGAKFTERFPNHEWAPKMAFRIGQCHYKLEEYGKAGLAFDAFVKTYPENELTAQALFWAGESYRTGKDIPEAFRRYNRCRWDFPESDAAKYSRGRLALPELLEQFEREANLDQ